ncbi:uncharacterized protein LOC143181509 [Calliopsis andreniformis]|uniref:uncharacterized protein LOC143181509 n=1 Tax=Calliopsis andreniformis TaxID=337506 RepID=UPI003FCE4544
MQSWMRHCSKKCSGGSGDISPEEPIKNEGSGKEPPLPSKTRYYCTKCDKSYSKKTDLSRHIRDWCDRVPRYKCPYCSYRSLYSSLVYQHVKKLHVGKHIHISKLF